MMKAILAASVLLAATIAQAQPPTVQGQEAPVPTANQIYVMRHLQKGQGEDPPLSPEGMAQANRLADLLSGSGIKAIFATATRRAQETAAPLAARLGIPVQTYDPRDPDALVNAAAAAPGDVLVVGHSNTVADLVGRFGGIAPAPLGDGDYGTIWFISPQRRETRTVSLAASD